MCVSCCVTEVTRKPGVIYTLMLLPAGRNEGPGKTAGEDPTHTTPPSPASFRKAYREPEKPGGFLGYMA